MAFTVTDRGTAYGTNDSGLTIASFTPGADKLLVVWYGINGPIDVSGITGHDAGGSWASIASLTGIDTGDSGRLHFWGCITGSSPSASSVVISHGGGYSRDQAAGCIEIDGADVSGTVANAFGQSGGTASYDSGGGPFTKSTTLSAFADSANMTLLAAITWAYNTTENWTVEAGWETMIHEQAGIATKTGAAAWNDGEDLSPSITSVHTYASKGVLAMEVKAAAGATGLPGSPVGRKSLLRGLL